jgi:hypothetical protein
LLAVLILQFRVLLVAEGLHRRCVDQPLVLHQSFCCIVTEQSTADVDSTIYSIAAHRHLLVDIVTYGVVGNSAFSSRRVSQT